MKRSLNLIAIASLILMASCMNISKSMREPNTRLNLQKSDFSLSEQVTGEASTTQILGIDFARLFMKRSAMVHKDGFPAGPLGIDISSIPVIGGFVMNKTSSYALYDMMDKNKGYDVVFYPQYEIVIDRPIGLGIIYRKTTVKATARLGKLNK